MHSRISVTFHVPYSKSNPPRSPPSGHFPPDPALDSPDRTVTEVGYPSDAPVEDVSRWGLSRKGR